MFKQSLLGSMIAMVTASLPKAAPTANDAVSFRPTRYVRSRDPNGNAERAMDGCYYHRDTDVRHGVPGAKLARMAAEGRVAKGQPR